ncbi:MAG: hypothetical protein KDH15_01090 [Rhodocyclaceae bacterium]|nr:hypothetical protein [Rhodocyclaceae bacterium]
MAAITADRNTPIRAAEDFEYPVDAGKKIYAGALVVVDTVDNLAKPAVTATTGRCVGVAQALADNSAGADGDVTVKVRRGCFLFKNSAAGDLVDLGDVGLDCYIVDDQTVAKTNGTNTRSVAGKVRDVDADGVWVEI